jgi:hypothetical protein
MEENLMARNKEFISTTFFMIIMFAFLGAGLGILFNSRGDLPSVIGGFVLTGVAISIFLTKVMRDG